MADEVLHIAMQSRPDLLPVPHAHLCPSCFDHAECRQTCSGFEDLGTANGFRLGSPALCDDCRPLTSCPHTPDGKLPDDEMAECEACPGTAYCRGDLDEPPPELTRLVTAKGARHGG